MGLVERTATQGGWSIFTFHGVGDGHLPVARPDFQELLAYLDAVRDRIWTAPVIEVAEDLHNQRLKI